MDKIYEDIQTYTPVSPNNLLLHVAKKKADGKRLLQLFATDMADHYELIYCFDEGDYKVDNLRLIAEDSEHVPSVYEYYPYSLYYELEARELFGIPIDVPEDQMNKSLYRTPDETPMSDDYQKIGLT